MALQKIYIPRDVRADLAAALREIRRAKRVALKIERENIHETGEFLCGFRKAMGTMADMLLSGRTQRRRLDRKRSYEEAIAMENIHQCETDA